MRLRCGHILFVLSLTPAVEAQQVVVQQPRVQVFSIDTTVSVPDGGSILLGGITTGASGRQVYGPLPWGSSWGQSYSSNLATGHVWIHDLRALDEAVLAEAGRRRHDSTIQRSTHSPGSRTAAPAFTPAVRQQAQTAMQQLLSRPPRK